MFDLLLIDEPLPMNGRLSVPDTPGFGVTLEPALTYDRPHSR